MEFHSFDRRLGLILFSLLFISTPLQAEEAPNLDGYLNNHPELTEAIRWEFPPLPPPPPPPPGDLFDGAPDWLSPTPLWKRFIQLFPKPRPKLPAGIIQFSPPDEHLDLELTPQIYEKLKIPFGSLPSNDPPSQPPQEPAPESISVLAQDWNQWTEAHKKKLREDFAATWNWVESCWPKYQEWIATNLKPAEFDACFSTAEPANYPPANLQLENNPPANASNWTVISSDAAFDLYSQMVALSLVLEIKGIFPWTLGELSGESRRELLDGSKWFAYVSPGKSYWGLIHQAGHLVKTTVLPAPAKLTLSFLVKNNLLGNTKLDTVVRVFAWERDNMWHTMGGNLHDDCPYKNGGLYSEGYRGRMPLTKVMNGTVMGCPLYFSNGQGGEFEFFDQNIHHWTGGCGGTSGFNQQVFRVAQIPAQMTSYGHHQNNFIVDNNVRLWIGHGDDTYGTKYAVWNGVAEIPIAEILIDDATYQSWVVDYDYKDPNLTQAQKDAYAAQNMRAVEQRTLDLMLKYLPKGMLKWHCSYDQGVPHDQTYLYTNYFNDIYTLAELEAMYLEPWGTNLPGVWQNIEARVAWLGGCNVYWQ